MVQLDQTPPPRGRCFGFREPTPDNDTSTQDTNATINISIEESALEEVIWNWNGTNYTMYNDSLVLMMNFDNVSSIGENDTFFVDLSPYRTDGTAVGFDGDEFVVGKYGKGIYINTLLFYSIRMWMGRCIWAIFQGDSLSATTMEIHGDVPVQVSVMTAYFR